MPRIRTIKPEFWGSPDTASAHPVTRLTYIALWNWADDYGRGTANFKELEGFVFPNDEVDELSDGKFRKFRDIVAEVQRAYKVTFYECDGRMFYEIPSWNEHQRTERKAKARIPDPSAGVIVDLTTGNAVTLGTSDAQRRNFRDTTEEAPQSPPPGKGTGEREREQGNSLLVQPERQDVENICTLLADRIESNGAKRPTITKQWKDAARLLIDKDGYTPDQVAWIINWSQDDEFWRTNILSMPKLRKQFEQLKLKSRAGTANGKPAPSQRMAETSSLGQRLQAQYDQKELL